MESENKISKFKKYYDVLSRVKCLEELMQFANERYEYYGKILKEASEHGFPPEMNDDFIEKVTAMHMSDQYLEFIKYLNKNIKRGSEKMNKMVDPTDKFHANDAQNGLI